MASIFTQRFGQGQRETVSEVAVKPLSDENRRPLRAARLEARRELAEYRTSDPSADYYLSSRPCANWKR